MAQSQSRWSKRRYFLTGISALILAILLYLAASPVFAVSPSLPEERLPIIGIDFGDSNTRVAVVINGTNRVLTGPAGERSIPTYVAFTDDGPLIGQAARDHLQIRPEQVIFDFKRLLGRKYKDIEHEVGSYPFEIVDLGGIPNIRVPGAVPGVVPRVVADAHINADQVAAIFFAGVKEFAGKALGYRVKEAVTTVPADFNDAQRAAVKAAAAANGMEIVRLINEPTAAIVAADLPLYSGKRINGRRFVEDRIILIHDIGGHNHGVTIASLYEGVVEILAVVQARDSAGSRFSSEVVGTLLQQNEVELSQLLKNRTIISQHQATLENAKHDLLDKPSARVYVQIPGLEDTIARADYEDRIVSIFDPTTLFEKALADSKLTKSDIHEVIVIGGSSRIQHVRKSAALYFNKTPLSNNTIDAAEAVVIGAAIQGSILNYPDDRDLCSLGIDFSVLHLGIELANVQLNSGDVLSYDNEGWLIMRGTTLPVKKSKTFTTVNDNQTALEIKLYQGTVDEKLGVEVNRGIIGVLRLDELPAAPAGTLQITVEITLDLDYYTELHAIDRQSGRNASLTIENAWAAKPLAEMAILKDGGEVALWKEVEPHDEL